MLRQLAASGYMNVHPAIDTILNVGAHPLHVVFSPTLGANYTKATQDVVINVTKITPTITFDAAPTPAYLGGNFIVSATTTNTDITSPVFSVQSGPCAIVSGAILRSTGVGLCVIQADDPVTTNFNPVSQVQNVTISQATPTLYITNSPVTYDGSPKATNVTDSVAGTVSNVQYDSSGTVPTEAGTYTITADFTPEDAVNYASLSGAPAGVFVITPSPLATTTTMTNSMHPHLLGQTWTLTATVTSGSSTSAGTVTFKDDSTILGTSDLAAGVATFEVSWLSGGTHQITAEYEGDSSFTRSASEAVTISVKYYLLLVLVYG